MTKAQSIYIHLPFCKTKCPYCDFASFAKQSEGLIDQYIKTLGTEIDIRTSKSPPLQAIKTIFFGGGTPSIHSPEEIESILNKIKKNFELDKQIEITLETNPGTIDKKKLQAFKDIGINRISVGIQSFDEKLLDKLGRGHSLKDSYEALDNIVDLEFKSWSMDLIYGLPQQSLDSWKNTINTALNFKPPHISAYALSIEKNTPYGQIYKDSSHADLPKEDNVVNMYRLTNEKFETNGLNRYEISNWAKDGHEAKHNLVYWKALEYYAFGLSAHGYINNHRYANTRNLKEYLGLTVQNIEQIENNNELISDTENLEEQILLKMRLNTGISLDGSLSTMLNLEKLKEHLKAGLIEKFDNGKRIKLSLNGVLVSNKVIADLIQ